MICVLTDSIQIENYGQFEIKRVGKDVLSKLEKSKKTKQSDQNN